MQKTTRAVFVFLALAVAGLCLLGGCSLFASASIPIDQLEKKLHEADTNGDGNLSGAELAAFIQSAKAS